MFESYPAYEKAFPASAVAATHGEEEGEESQRRLPRGARETDDDVDPVELVKQKYPNAISKLVVDFLYDVLGGV